MKSLCPLLVKKQKCRLLIAIKCSLQFTNLGAGSDTEAHHEAFEECNC